MCGTLRSNTTPGLFAEVRQWCSFDIPKMTHGNNYRIIWIEILCIELMFIRNNLCAAVITVFLLYLVQLILHHLLTKFGIRKNVFQISDEFFQFIIFCMQLIHAKSCQLRQTHVNNGLTLQIIQVKPLFQISLSFRRRLTSTDDVNHFVNVVACNNQAFQDMGAFLRFLQLKLGPADGYIMAMLHKVLHTFFQAQQAWTTFNQRDVVNRE